MQKRGSLSVLISNKDCLMLSKKAQAALKFDLC
jgi:hypothetical protein